MEPIDSHTEQQVQAQRLISTFSLVRAAEGRLQVRVCRVRALEPQVVDPVAEVMARGRVAADRQDRLADRLACSDPLES